MAAKYKDILGQSSFGSWKLPFFLLAYDCFHSLISAIHQAHPCTQILEIPLPLLCGEPEVRICSPSGCRFGHHSEDNWRSPSTKTGDQLGVYRFPSFILYIGALISKSTQSPVSSVREHMSNEEKFGHIMTFRFWLLILFIKKAEMDLEI